MTGRDQIDIEATPDAADDTAASPAEPPASPPAEREPEPVDIHLVETETGEEVAPEDVVPAAATAGQFGDTDTDIDELAAAEAAVSDDISRVMSERDDYLDALRRLQADFENYKKRVLKQQTEHLERAAEDLVLKLLPVLDTGELARSHGGDDAVVQVTAMLYDTLAKEGLDAIPAAPGTPFDPTVHEAVAHEPGDEGEATVSELLRAGYRWKGRLVRPAMVKVKG